MVGLADDALLMLLLVGGALNSYKDGDAWAGELAGGV